MSIISSKAEHVYKSNTLMQEAYQLLSALIFKCGECKYTCLIGMRERPKMPWTLTKEWILAASIRRWNAMCNGDRKYKLIRESLGGRR